MKKLVVTVFTFIFFVALSYGQQNNKLISGPWAGNVELRTATIWMEVSPSVKKINIKYHPISNEAAVKNVQYKGELGKEFNPIKIDLNDLEFGTAYSYEIFLDNKKIPLSFQTNFTTKDLWQYRKPAPDFSVKPLYKVKG
jgi:alkaline phosphatase D